MADDQQNRRRTAMRNCLRVLDARFTLTTIRQELDALGQLDGLDELPDSYGEGGPVSRLEQRVAELLGTEEAVWFPTGTMAQQVALRYGAELTGRDAVVLHPWSHLERWERHAYSQLTALRALWPTDRPRPFTADELTALGQPFGTVTVELPLRDAGFLLPSWDELVAVTEAARAAGARVHFDGARLWDSTSHLGRSLAEVAALADSVYVSFYKTLGAMHGAALAGDAALAAYARTWRHRYGGTLYQDWPAALGALAGLDRELPRIPEYAAHAKVVAEALAALPGARIDPAPPHPAEALAAATLALAETERTWFVGGWSEAAPGVAVAEVSVRARSLDWTAEDVLEVGERFLALARAQ